MTNQSGLLLVYWLAERAIAEAGAQLPSWEMEPTILMVWPYVVVTSSLKVTATVEAMVQEVALEEGAEEVALPDPVVVTAPVAVVEGHTVLLAVTKDPVAEVAWQTDGMLVAVLPPHVGGTTEFLALTAVRKAA